MPPYVQSRSHIAGFVPGVVQVHIIGIPDQTVLYLKK